MSPEYIKEWVRKAEADHLAAVRALHDARHRKDQSEIACFHAQQCVEKYLKALLVLCGRQAPRSHDLLALAKILEDSKISAYALENEFRDLNRYAIEIRYPGETATLREATESVRQMKKIINFAANIIKKRLKKTKR